MSTGVVFDEVAMLETLGLLEFGRIETFTFYESPVKAACESLPPTYHGKKPIPPPISKRRKQSMAKWRGIR